MNDKDKPSRFADMDLRPVPDPPAKPVSLTECRQAPEVAVVKRLEKLLELAKTGRLQGLVGVLWMDDACTSHVRVGRLDHRDVLLSIEDMRFFLMHDRHAPDDEEEE